MRKSLWLCLFILISGVAAGQTKEQKEKALELGREAIRIMDEGKIDESIGLLEQAQALDPDHFVYPYEIAYAYYLKKNYETSLNLSRPLLKHKDANDRIYQMVGNTYDLLEQPEKALETYADGLKKFPTSGKLYLESGIVENLRGNYNEAVNHWEKGIKVDPNFSSNYYWLCKIFSSTDERIWALMYGEIFMLLEPGSKRTEEISKLLYDIYRNTYVVKSDSTGEFQLTKMGFQIVINSKKDLKKMKGPILPFEGTYATVFTLAALDFHKGIDLHSINRARTSFINTWFTKHHKEYGNRLFEYQKTMQDNNVFEAFNYWMLSQGDPNAFDAWYADNKNSFELFAKWMKSNPINLQSKDSYARVDYQ